MANTVTRFPPNIRCGTNAFDDENASQHLDRQGGAHGVMVLGMSSESYHEPHELLSEPTRNLHRAIVSLKEELEAVDWYQQRAEACSDEQLRAVLVHNKNEEVEHAMMTLEWLRRTDPVFAVNIATYLASSGPITEVEKSATGGPGGSAPPSTSGSLGIGSLKGWK